MVVDFSEIIDLLKKYNIWIRHHFQIQMVINNWNIHRKSCNFISNDDSTPTGGIPPSDIPDRLPIVTEEEIHQCQVTWTPREVVPDCVKRAAEDDESTEDEGDRSWEKIRNTWRWLERRITYMIKSEMKKIKNVKLAFFLVKTKTNFTNLEIISRNILTLAEITIFWPVQKKNKFWKNLVSCSLKWWFTGSR